MWSRIPVLLIGIPTVYYVLHVGATARLLLLLIICLGAQIEFSNLTSRSAGAFPLPECAGGTALMIAADRFGERGLIAGIAFFEIMMVFFLVLRGLKGNGFTRFATANTSLLYIPFCLAFFLMLGRITGPSALFAILIMIWALDIGAYSFGMALRGPKLAPMISPNKTLSGAIGGVITCLATAWLLWNYGFISISQTRLFILAGSCALVSQTADLFESLIKREFGKKDSSNILGAHGGILDRIDSILFMGPIAYFIILI